MKNSWFKQFINGLGWLALTVFLVPQVRADLFVSSQTEANAGDILRYDQVTGAFRGVFASGHGLADPLGLTFGPDGNLYVASGNSDQVLRFDGRTGAFLGVFAAGGGCGHVCGSSSSSDVSPRSEGERVSLALGLAAKHMPHALLRLNSRGLRLNALQAAGRSCPAGFVACC